MRKRNHICLSEYLKKRALAAQCKKQENETEERRQTRLSTNPNRAVEKRKPESLEELQKEVINVHAIRAAKMRAKRRAAAKKKDAEMQANMIAEAKKAEERKEATKIISDAKSAVKRRNAEIEAKLVAYVTEKQKREIQLANVTQMVVKDEFAGKTNLFAKNHCINTESGQQKNITVVVVMGEHGAEIKNREALERNTAKMVIMDKRTAESKNREIQGENTARMVDITKLAPGRNRKTQEQSTSNLAKYAIVNKIGKVQDKSTSRTEFMAENVVKNKSELKQYTERMTSITKPVIGRNIKTQDFKARNTYSLNHIFHLEDYIFSMYAT
ncbi:hypothetical protein CDAR_590941 [Caerostris darwini]|uniref:Uncharacterized protein n=1 Tax=Caerostris darwini TaxID=1538125 RepID=A0AAV4SJ80_9ARAC|nr:hypothetical protein CDAR_590941 [Caerostris darwini]